MKVTITITIPEAEAKGYTQDDFERHRKDIVETLPDELHSLARRLRLRTGAEVKWGFENIS
jgi:hypothetical protein